MDSLLTYDITKKHIDVKNAMIRKGYMKSWTSNGTTYHLPNTTLWKNSTTPATAIKDLQAVIQLLNSQAPVNEHIRVERAMAVEFISWSGIPGEPN